MSLTKKRKRAMLERLKVNPLNKCILCGKSLKGSIHHFYCDDCWQPKYLRMYQKEKREIFKKLIEEEKEEVERGQKKSKNIKKLNKMRWV